jgi:capsular polysaccharide transport system permease protein
MSDVDSAEKQERAAVLALSNYRNQQSLYDPQRQSDLQLQEITALQTDLAATRKQIADLKAIARDNPQIAVLENRERVSQSQIGAEMAKVAGGHASLSSKAPEYEAITLDRDFADKYLGVALDSLEQARENAMSQQLYVERVAEPSRPDIAMEPRRVRDVLVTFLLSLLVWGIASLLVTAAREHRT